MCEYAIPSEARHKTVPAKTVAGIYDPWRVRNRNIRVAMFGPIERFGTRNYEDNLVSKPLHSAREHEWIVVSVAVEANFQIRLEFYLGSMFATAVLTAWRWPDFLQEGRSSERQ